MDHQGNWYDYKSALELRYPPKKSLAEQHHGQHTSLNVRFDNTEDAAGFMNAVYMPKAGREIYQAELSFVNPRDPDTLTKDYSEMCCNIM